MKIFTSIVLTLVLGYVLYQRLNQWITGMNPYVDIILWVLLGGIFLVNFYITSKIEAGNVKIGLRILLLLGVFVPVISFYCNKKEISDSNPVRRYIDSSNNQK